MDEKEYSRAISEALESAERTVDDLKKCLFSRNKRLMSETKKSLMKNVKASLPLFEQAMGKKEKESVDQWILELLPSLQRLGIAVEDLAAGVQMAVDAEVPLTDKALSEISEVLALLKDLARDTKDVLATRNANFRAYGTSSAEHLLQMACDCGIEHQKRLIEGVCTPKASFLYLSIIDAAKRIAQELGGLCNKA